MYKTLIDFNSLLNQLDNNNLVIFDVRYDIMNKSAGREEYSLSHIPVYIIIERIKNCKKNNVFRKPKFLRNYTDVNIMSFHMPGNVGILNTKIVSFLR